MTGRPVTVFEQIGGEPAVRRLVEAFYDIVENDPAARAVHDLHLGRFGMGHIRTAQFEFLCGFFGGPRYYVERTGHSNLRNIHDHLAFGEGEAQVWLDCMDRALDQAGIASPMKRKIMATFTTAARVLAERSIQRHAQDAASAD